MNPTAFDEPLKNSRILFDYSKIKYNHEMTFLDIGGGFVGAKGKETLFEETAKRINESIGRYFAREQFKDLEIIAEPGSYYVDSAFTLVTNVIAKRVSDVNGEKSFMYYIDEGAYGGLNKPMHYADFEYKPIVLKEIGADDLIFETSSIWGPTCCGLDRVSKSIKLPELNYGDQLAFENCGAYTITLSSCFNGRPKPKNIHLVSPTCWSSIKDAFHNKQSKALLNVEVIVEDNKVANSTSRNFMFGFFSYIVSYLSFVSIGKLTHQASN
jgi:ornithine decarboxylase